MKFTKPIIAAGTLAALVAACQGTTPTTQNSDVQVPIPPLSGRRILLNADGVPVAVPTPISDTRNVPRDSDKPLDPAAEAKKVHPLHKRTRRNVYASPEPGNPDFGTQIYPTNDNNGAIGAGIFALQQIQPTLSLSSTTGDVTLFTPTLLIPNNYTCESSVSYFRYPSTGDTTTYRQWGAWDWNHWGKTYNFTDTVPISGRTFLDTYTFPDANGKRWMYAENFGTSHNHCEVMLYNVLTSSWNTIYTSTNFDTDADKSGWDIYETYLNGQCPTLPRIESKDLQVYGADGVWHSVTSSYGQSYPGWNTCLPHGWISNYYDWWVNN